MSHSAALVGFAFGEHLDGLPPRSLGYRLLVPSQPEPWSDEVEALARHLQSAPYPDHWPETDLFCSVLLTTGGRLVARARYGLVDGTPHGRRGGLELIGVVGPADLDIPSALAVSRWLHARREQAETLLTLGGRFALADVLAAVTPTPAEREPLPVLPVRLWQDGVLLFAATTPTEPDHRLALLDPTGGRPWQWLPFVGPDFPLAEYARRGTVVAWTPHLTGVAPRVADKTDLKLTRPRRSRALPTAILLALIAVGALLFANLLAYQNLGRQIAALAPVREPAAAPPGVPIAPAPTPSETGDGRDRLAEALHDLLQERVGKREWSEARDVFLARYERAARTRPDLRLAETNVKGRLAIGALSVLSGRGADRVEDLVKAALAGKGFDAALVSVAAERVRTALTEEARRDGP